MIIGTNQYTNVIAGMVSKIELSSHLGQGFFRRHVCYFDFPNQKLYLLPGEHFRDQDEFENISGDVPAANRRQDDGVLWSRALRPSKPGSGRMTN